MFNAYQESRSIAQVVALCKVNKKTAQKWRVRDNWDLRCDEIEAKLRKKMERKIVGRRLRNVKILDTAIEGIAEGLEDGMRLEPKMLPRLIMTQDLLIGRGAADEEQPSVSPEAKAALEKLVALGEEGVRLLADSIADTLETQSSSGVSQPLLTYNPEKELMVSKGGVVKRKPKGGFGTAKKAKNL